MQAEGTFVVSLTPAGDSDSSIGGLGRMTIAKEFSGDLTGPSAGYMLTAMTPVETSAGYVAVERVNGFLGGRTGSFTLLHYGVAHSSGNRLILEVVPDSGTDGLSGISGSMKIDRSGAEHRYEFSYDLPESG